MPKNILIGQSGGPTVAINASLVGAIIELLKNSESINLNVLQRCASHISSDIDIAEASEVGMAAVKYAVSGRTGVVATIKRISNQPYKVEYDCCEVDN